MGGLAKAHAPDIRHTPDGMGADDHFMGIKAHHAEVLLSMTAIGVSLAIAAATLAAWRGGCGAAAADWEPSRRTGNFFACTVSSYSYAARTSELA